MPCRQQPGMGRDSLRGESGLQGFKLLNSGANDGDVVFHF